MRKRDLVRSLCAAALCAAVAGSATTAVAQTCTIDGGATKQTIDGFGFSTAWSGRLSSAQGDVLFGTGNGQLGFSFLRIRIDPTQAWADETNNSSIAHARGAKVLGSPWSPPASMKTNGNVVHGSLLTSQYAAYASYLSRAATSIGLDYVSLQNEPDYDPTWEGCTWTPDALRTFVLNNASAIGKPVVMPEGTDFKDTISDPTLNDAGAASRIAVVAGHFYNEGNTNNGNYVHQNAISKGKRVWMTEHYFSGTDIGTCMSIARELSDAMNNQFNAYFWWWMANGGDGNFITGTTPMKNGYTLGQFARFVRPGMVRIGTTYSPRANVYVTAYTGSGKLVVIAVNTGTAAVSQTFALQNVSVTSLTAARTSASENMAQLPAAAVSSGSFTSTLPAQSITTFVGTIGGNTGPYALTVTKAGTGSGTVTGTNIDCGTSCSATLASGTTVTLTAAAASGSTFAGWGGACTGTGSCVVTMTAAQAVTATFNVSGGTSYALTVTKAGTGTGTVTSSTGGISCGTSCSATLASGTAVTLTATPASGSTFAGWGGACTGTGACVVTMTAARAVTATFNPSGGSTPCANPITFTGNTGNFNTASAVCYRTSQTVNGWGCSNFQGRTVSVNGGAATATCGAGPFPLSKSADGFTYFSVTAGTYTWANLYVW